MPRKGYASITLKDKIVKLIDKYIEDHRHELEIKGQDSRSAIVRQAIWLWAKQKDLVPEESKQ